MSAAQHLAEAIPAAFRSGNVDEWANLFAEDAVQVHPLAPQPNVGRAAIRAFEAPLFASFSDVDLSVEGVVEQGDWVAFEVQVAATHTAPLEGPAGTIPATGRRINLMMASFIRLNADGLIAEEHRYQDTGAFMAQLLGNA